MNGSNKQLKSSYDVVIVGSSPAGASAAKALRRIIFWQNLGVGASF
jgi:alkyl hydroperoxide reductase subunit AhpF